MSQTSQLQHLDPDTLNDLNDLKNTREDVLRQLGRERGLEEGRERGLEEGRERGLEEGRKEGERRKATEIAKNLLAQKIPLDVIARATGLSLTDLQSLTPS